MEHIQRQSIERMTTRTKTNIKWLDGAGSDGKNTNKQPDGKVEGKRPNGVI